MLFFGGYVDVIDLFLTCGCRNFFFLFDLVGGLFYAGGPAFCPCCFCGGHVDAIDLCPTCVLAHGTGAVVWRRGLIGVASASPSLLLAGVYAMSAWSDKWAETKLRGLDIRALIRLHEEKTAPRDEAVARGRTVTAETVREQLDLISARIRDIRGRTAPVGVHCPVCVLEPSAAYGSSVVLVRTL